MAIGCIRYNLNMFHKIIYNTLTYNIYKNLFKWLRNFCILKNKLDGVAPLFVSPPPAYSTIIHSRLVRQDRNLCLDRNTLIFPSTARQSQLLNHLGCFKIIHDLECPQVVQHTLLYNCLRSLLLFWCGGAVNTAEEDHSHLIKLWLDYNRVCRAAPGFARDWKIY